MEEAGQAAAGGAAETQGGEPAAAPPRERRHDRPAQPTRALALGRLLEGRRGERHIVAIQDFPDPDAISSGLAYREIARHYDVDADIVYDGTISHPENLALVNLLDIRLLKFGDQPPLAEYHAAVFVDNQGTTTHLTERLKAAGVPTLAVIDHHDPQDVLDPVFADVRPVGAAATILTEYLQEGCLIALEAGNVRHVQLATALMHGIHSETDGFVRARDPEYRAAAYLSRFIDHDLLERVLCVQKSRATMDVIEAALRNRVLRSGFSIAGVGVVRWADRDAIPQAADFLLTEENVHTAVVYGLLREDDGREVVSGSLRTVKATLGVDGYLKKSLGRDAQGRFYGGGRSRAGGFEVGLGFLAGGEEDELTEKWTIFHRRIRRLLFRAAGAEEPCEEEGDGE